MDVEQLIYRIKNDPEWVVLGLLVFFILVGGGAYYYHSIRQEETEATQHFSAILQGYMMAETTEDYEELAGQFQQMFSMYEETEVADKILFYLGRSLLEAQDYEAAVEQFGRLASQFPDSFFAGSSYLHAAYAQYYLENYDHALSQLEGALYHLEENHPLRVEVLWQKARIYADQGESEEQKRVLEQLLETAEAGQEYWRRRAREELIELVG